MSEEIEFKRRLIINKPICPYCGHKFEKRVDRSRGCPSCKRRIFVRTVNGEKWLMTKYKSIELFDTPTVKYDQTRGNPSDYLCVCESCGSMESYFWLFIIDHFTLECVYCHERAVKRFPTGKKATSSAISILLDSRTTRTRSEKSEKSAKTPDKCSVWSD